MRTFDGRAVALLESRKSGELAAMVKRLGGIPISAPAVIERPTGIDTSRLVNEIALGTFTVAVVLTGAAATALFKEADRLGAYLAVIKAMRRMTIACRGPKPLAILKQHDLVPAIVTARPHTTNELIEALTATPLQSAALLLLHYGERNEPLTLALRSRGAAVEDVCLYEWALPDNVEPMQSLVRRTIAGEVDAALFTSQIQFRFLIQVAAAMNAERDFVAALNDRVVVGAIGPVCAGALRDGGVVADVMPAASNSASLVGAVADYFALIQPSTGAQPT